MSARPNLTRNQSLVFDTLDGADEPLSAYTILDRLRDEGFRAPLQVYRALDKLIDCGLIHRIDSRKAFVACTHPGEHHGSAMIAFGICESCARVWEFSDDVICERLQGWAESEGFRPVRTSIEINGRCAECSRNEAGS